MRPLTPTPSTTASAAGRAALLLPIAVLLVLPIATVFASWFQWDDTSAQILREMGRTVLPTYAWTTAQLALMVGLGAACVGTAGAVLVTLFDFRGRRTMEWLLLLPLAMPAYVTAFAYTDFLQFAGPLQTWLRATFGLEGRLLPDIRSLGGAALVFVFTLYPYIYLLARGALAERAPHLLEAARMLGASPRRRILAVALPLARPSIAVGVALVLMETLADYGVTSYFGIQTFTTGIYRAWLSMDNRVAAAQLATVLLACVAALLWVERRAQRRMRFASAHGGRASGLDARAIALTGPRAFAAFTFCLLPVLLGFVLPVLFMFRPLVADWSVIPWSRFVKWTWDSVRLGFAGALLAVVVALLLAFLARRRADWPTRAVVQATGLGYAVPGAVIVVGLLLPVGWLQAAAPELNMGGWITATVAGILWAYLMRFGAVALQSIQGGYTRVPQRLDDSARMLGTGAFGLFRRVHWPLLRRTSAVAALLVFVDVMKELPATMVLRPFNTDTLAVIAFQLARDERLSEAALPSLALVLVGLIPVVILSRAIRAPADRA